MIVAREKNSLLLAIFVFIASCATQDGRTFRSDGNSFVINYSVNNKPQTLRVWFDSIGGLKTIENFRNDNEYDTRLDFYSNGITESIEYYKNSKKEGRCYTYYPSGIKESELIYEKGINVGYGMEYYDTTANLKLIVLYNDSGQVYYLQRNAPDGTVIEEKGKR